MGALLAARSHRVQGCMVAGWEGPVLPRLSDRLRGAQVVLREGMNLMRVQRQSAASARWRYRH
jgi:hypothetical protein